MYVCPRYRVGRKIDNFCVEAVGPPGSPGPIGPPGPVWTGKTGFGAAAQAPPMGAGYQNFYELPSCATTPRPRTSPQPTGGTGGTGTLARRGPYVLTFCFPGLSRHP